MLLSSMILVYFLLGSNEGVECVCDGPAIAQ